MRRSHNCSTKSKQLLIIAVLLLFYCFNACGQNKITGAVTNINMVPLEAATISNKTTGAQTISNKDGSFSIVAGKGDMISISFVGYVPKQFEISNDTSLDVQLEELVSNLEDVVMVGYVAQKVKEITGSVAVVKPKDLTAVPAGQVEQMLQGRAAGLNVITSGMPGGASNVRIHGLGNFGDVTPLYIIDGVQGNINNLNPDDIESLQVLKDAGAYSIYGVRGANGVIVVTTKSGKNGKPKISYDFYIGTTRPLKGPDLLNPQENADLTWIALKNAGEVDANGNPNDQLYGNGPTPVLPDYLVAGPYRGVDATGDRVNPDLYNIDFTVGDIYQITQSNKTGTDWFHEVFKPAITQNHTATVSGGNDKNKYLFSLGYLNQQGTMLYTWLKRFTVRVNTTFSVNDKIRIGENLQLSSRDNPQIATQQGLNSNEIAGTFSSLPIMPVYDIKGGWASLQNADLSDNIVATRTFAKDNKNDYWDVMGSGWAEADLLKYFTFKTQFGGTLNFYHLTNYNFFSYEPLNGLPNNSLTESSGYFRSYTWTNTLSFSKTFNKNHVIKALAGTEYINNYNSESGGMRTGFFSNDPNYRFLTNGNPATQRNYSFAGISVLTSFISSINYGFKDKYYVSATLRNDGSSVFGPENRYGWFPSLSAAWRLTQENFLKESSWLTELKLRASWGKSGFYGNTDPSNQYTLYGGTVADSYYDIYGSSTSAVQGFRVTRIGEPKTGWQEDVVANAGLESILWNGKLSATVDVYQKTSKGLLFPITLPDILGGAIPPNINVGDVKNTGMDVLLGSEGKLNKNVAWNTTVTFTTYKNKIIKVNDQTTFFDAPYNQAGVFTVRNAIGHPASSFYGYKIIGFFQNEEDVNKSPVQPDAAPGRFKYLDADGNDTINDKDRVYFGNPNPKFTLGINIGITYRNFDLSAFFYGSFGNDVLNAGRGLTDIYAPFPINPVVAKSRTALYDSWTPTHTNAKAPIVEDNFNFSIDPTINSYCLEDGTYFRNKTIMLGYTLPKNVLQKIKIDNLRIYIQAVNLFTITNYSGLDPELSGHSDAFGIDFGNYPDNQKQYFIGMNVNF